MPQNKLQIRRVSDAVAASLERRILEGTLKPGDRLPPERELAADLGVSRPSLREAIQKLASKGMLQSRHGGGTYVTERLVSTFYDPWRDMLGTQPRLYDDMLELRRMLEGQAAEWAAERATEADLIRIDKAFSMLAQTFSTNDVGGRFAADVAFHQAIVEASHNAMLGHLVATLLQLMHDSIQLNLAELQHLPAASPLLLKLHEAIFVAIRDRKPRSARAATETHFDFVRETLAQSQRSAERRETAERRLNGIA